MTSFTEMIFQIGVNISGGDLFIPILFVAIGLAVILISLRFPLGAWYVLFFGFSYGLMNYFNVHESFFTIFVILVILGGFGLGFFVWSSFSRGG